MNIILVVFDSLRKDCIGVFGEPPWGKVATPHLDEFASQSLSIMNAYPESLPTLPTRRALYTGRRCYPFHGADFRLKGDFVGAAGWGPIPEDQPTVAEMLREDGYRTALIADVYHMFKPSKNFWRGFDQWVFLRGQENDTYRSGPLPSEEMIAKYLPLELWSENRVKFVRQCLMNMYDRHIEEDYFNARVMIEAARWLQQNNDARKFFLVVESFDPHEPWFVPEHYRKMYDKGNGQEQVISGYESVDGMKPQLLRRTQANYSGLVTMCDKWFGYLMDSLKSLGMLDNTIVILTADHGHSIGDQNYMGKRGYPSRPEVYDVPLMVRHPKGKGAGQRADTFVQHTDMAAQILDFAGVQAPDKFDGMPFWSAGLDNKTHRTHVTVGWGTGMTVINDSWWFNAKIDGTGVFLYNMKEDPKMLRNVADEHIDISRGLYSLGMQDAGGGFPDYIKEMCAKATDAPGCSSMAARE